MIIFTPLVRRFIGYVITLDIIFLAFVHLVFKKEFLYTPIYWGVIEFVFFIAISGGFISAVLEEYSRKNAIRWQESQQKKRFEEAEFREYCREEARGILARLDIKNPGLEFMVGRGFQTYGSSNRDFVAKLADLISPHKPQQTHTD